MCPACVERGRGHGWGEEMSLLEHSFGDGQSHGCGEGTSADMYRAPRLRPPPFPFFPWDAMMVLPFARMMMAMRMTRCGCCVVGVVCDVQRLGMPACAAAAAPASLMSRAA